MKSGPLEKINDVDEDCFVSPVVITVKSDKSVKIALDSRKLNDSCIKMRPHMPNMEELLNQISVEITRDRTAQLFLSKIDLDYAYGKMKLSDETSRQCVFTLTGGNFSGYYRFKKGFYGLADIPTKQMAGTRNKRERNQTDRRKSGSHIEVESTGKHERSEIISRCHTIHGKNFTEIFGTNKPT